MSEHDQYGYQSQHGGHYPPLWRPQVPSPYVTHQDMAPVHSKIGELQQGQVSIMQTYAHLRGDMLSGFEKIEAAIKAQAPQQSGVNLSGREMVIVAVALVLAGAILSRLPGVETVLGMG